MTSLNLLLWIVLGVGVQLALWIGIGITTVLSMLSWCQSCQSRREVAFF
jgi:hypothetical protein